MAAVAVVLAQLVKLQVVQVGQVVMVAQVARHRLQDHPLPEPVAAAVAVVITLSDLAVLVEPVAVVLVVKEPSTTATAQMDPSTQAVEPEVAHVVKQPEHQPVEPADLELLS